MGSSRFYEPPAESEERGGHVNETVHENPEIRSEWYPCTFFHLIADGERP